MNQLDWDLCTRRLMDRGIKDYTDGDIISEYDDLCQERLAKAQAEKDALDAAQAIKNQVVEPQTPLVQPQAPVVTASRKSRWRGNVA